MSDLPFAHHPRSLVSLLEIPLPKSLASPEEQSYQKCTRRHNLFELARRRTWCPAKVPLRSNRKLFPRQASSVLL